MVQKLKKLKRPKVEFPKKRKLTKEEKELEMLKRQGIKVKEPPRRKIKRAVPRKKKK